jgi:hypothetical protein
MSSLHDPLIFTCANCEASIQGDVTFFVGLAFCCAGCVAGGPCTCSYDTAPMAAPHTARSVVPPPGASPDVAGPPAMMEEPAVTEEPPAVPVGARQPGQLVRVG